MATKKKQPANKKTGIVRNIKSAPKRNKKNYQEEDDEPDPEYDELENDNEEAQYDDRDHDYIEEEDDDDPDNTKDYY